MAQDFPERLIHNDVIVGKLSRQQFAQLDEAYGKRSGRTYRANRSYRLVDFLPLTLRRLVGKQLIPDSIPFSKSLSPEVNVGNLYGPLSLVTNCHATAYLGLYAFNAKTSSATKRPMFFFADAVQMAEALKRPELRTQTFPPKLVHPTRYARARNAGRKPGDVVSFLDPSKSPQDQSRLLHSMIWIGKDLYLHQHDTGSPWVVSTWAEGLAWGRQNLKGRRLPEVVVSTVASGATLPHPKKVFGIRRADPFVFERLVSFDAKQAKAFERTAVPEYEPSTGGGGKTHLFGASW